MLLAKGSFSFILCSIIAVILCVLGVFFETGIVQTMFLFFFVLSFLVFCIFLIFFRDPERSVGSGIVACADGKIREILEMKDTDIGECIRISTFMNIQNVHVNRMPIDGTIKKIHYVQGSHLPAFQKESECNERLVFLITTSLGTIKIIQIAGTIARRIVPYHKEGDVLEKGGKLGLIRFGSRVDVYLPTKMIKKISIHLHQRVQAGVDTLAEISE